MPEYAKMKKPDVKLVILGDMNVGKTSLLHRYMERKFKETISTVGGAFFLKQWGPYNISIWDTAGREQFHGLGSMYCRGAAAIILTYDVTNWQSLAELEDRFLSLTDTANSDCIFAVVGNKADLTDPEAGLKEEEGEEEGGEGEKAERPAHPPPSPVARRQVHREDAIALYGRILRYKMLDERTSLPAEKMCFETSAKTGYNVDLLFETLFDMVLPSILKKRSGNDSPTVDLEECHSAKRTKAGCCS
ncbi:ras-related protein Rab-20-like [Megalops cyprinoides]|uniref:ras-related protein Rab-20-like n=1 Tax=Megalops cyprinoides TaxID=118141 RepID=UPI001863BC25|nr:ras-related protein Rab-20-like [Megalops cyprinoides]